MKKNLYFAKIKKRINAVLMKNIYRLKGLQLYLLLNFPIARFFLSFGDRLFSHMLYLSGF